jgi:hypothetical protein
MADELVPSQAPSAATVAADVVPAIEMLDLFDAGEWRLVLAADGWYVLAGQVATHLTVDGAVRKLAENPAVGKHARGPVFKTTRQYFAALGTKLAEGSWISPTADHALRGTGLDLKLPAEQIATAGEGLAKLARELAEAEIAPVL